MLKNAEVMWVDTGQWDNREPERVRRRASPVCHINCWRCVVLELPCSWTKLGMLEILLPTPKDPLLEVPRGP